MKHFTPFRIYQNPLEAEELIEVLQKHNIPFDRSFEKMADSENYIGSNPFDANIILKIKDEDFSRVEALIKEKSNI
jgi:epoxyqueuosine reductase QueG